jgi:hypothetical protein
MNPDYFMSTFGYQRVSEEKPMNMATISIITEEQSKALQMVRKEIPILWKEITMNSCCEIYCPKEPVCEICWNNAADKQRGGTNENYCSH